MAEAATLTELHARWRSCVRYSKKFWTCVGSRVSGDWWWYLARSVKVARYNFWVDAENSRNDISRTMRSRNTLMGCLRAEGTRDAHHERHTEDTGAEMGNGTRRGRSGGRRSARLTTKAGVARRNPRSGSFNASSLRPYDEAGCAPRRVRRTAARKRGRPEVESLWREDNRGRDRAHLAREDR